MNNPINTAQPEYDNFTDTLPDCECRLIVEPLFLSDPQPPRPPFCSNCVDCGVDTMGENSHEIYMVFGSIWRASGVCECKLLCIGCLERRIGRLLHSGDFTRCPLNYLNAKGLRPVTPRLLHRLFTPYGKDNPFHDAVRRAHSFAQDTISQRRNVGLANGRLRQLIRDLREPHETLKINQNKETT